MSNNTSPTWREQIATNPVGMTADARAAMDRELGAEKAKQMRYQAAQSMADQIRVITKKGD